MDHVWISRLSDISSIAYLPLLVGTYIGLLIRVFRKWWAIMKWQDIVLVCMSLLLLAMATIPPTLRYAGEPNPLQLENVGLKAQVSDLQGKIRKLNKDAADQGAARLTLKADREKLAALQKSNADLQQKIQNAIREIVGKDINAIEAAQIALDETRSNAKACQAKLASMSRPNPDDPDTMFLNDGVTAHDYAEAQRQLSSAFTENAKQSVALIEAEQKLDNTLGGLEAGWNFFSSDVWNAEIDKDKNSPNRVK